MITLSAPGEPEFAGSLHASIDRTRRLCFQSILCVCLLLCMSVTVITTKAADLVVDGTGQLLGATDVDVDGTLYDVSFVDGVGRDIFGIGFTDGSGLLFTSAVDGQAASMALAAQVFINTPQGDFDDIPSLIRGCESPFACLVFTPYGGNNAMRVRVIDGEESITGTFFGPTTNDDDFTTSNYGDSRTWAIWTETATEGDPPGAENGIVGSWYNLSDPDPINMLAG